MKIRKAIAWGMLAVSLLTAVSGCGTGNKTADDNGVTTIYCYMNNGVATGSGAESGSNQEQLEKIQKYFIDKLNIKVVPITPPAGSATEKLNTLLASQEQLDLFWGKWDDYATNGAIMPIGQLLDQYGENIKNKWPDSSWNVMTDSSGDLWGVPRFTETRSYPVYIRKDWLEKYNLEAPKTLDDLEHVAQVFKENDPAGNNGTIPIITQLDGLQMGVTAGFTGIGYGVYLDSSDSKVKPVEMMPEFKDFIAKMNSWYTKGLIYKESFSVSQSQIREFIKQNKVGIHLAWYSNVTGFEAALRENYPEAYYEVYNITGPKGDIQTVRKATTNGALIPANSKNAEAVIKFMDCLYGDVDSYLTACRGIENEDWEYVDRDKLIVKSLNEEQRYFGELNAALSTVMENDIYDADNMEDKSLTYLRTTCIDQNIGVQPFNKDFNFSTAKLTEAAPGRGDIERMIKEETTKFITGARKLSEYDLFISELNAAGIQNLIDEYTRQYNEIK